MSGRTNPALIGPLSLKPGPKLPNTSEVIATCETHPTLMDDTICDGYVTYHSTRIESCQRASLDNSKRGVAFLEMLDNCMDQIRGPSSPEGPHHQRVFMRCDVNFDTTLYGRNSFIGRAAHIEFLESDIFARFIMWSFQNLFR
ncbi:hypothetical protein F2Q70_00039890 [Brassica cretica]|uniref:Uncharacterized protein n=1 Tax=Brassica cretica TaxID=69181 RepID=A0A8S9K9A7_BRACR|nr:hypothetical protein F2Q70_00039890 [Brassica cretica]